LYVSFDFGVVLEDVRRFGVVAVVVVGFVWFVGGVFF